MQKDTNDQDVGKAEGGFLELNDSDVITRLESKFWRDRDGLRERTSVNVCLCLFVCLCERHRELCV